jgi:hypothetical protein
MIERVRRPGVPGIALGIVAFLITLPPFEVRTIVPSLVLAAAGAALGVVELRAGERRPGWGALVAALLGALGAYGATHSGVSHLEVVVSWSALTAAMLRYAAPLTFAGLGGLVSERAGVVNIALEGMMLMGAFFAAYGADKTGSWVLGLAIGVLAGMALAAIHAVWAVTMRADQIVSTCPRCPSCTCRPDRWASSATPSRISTCWCGARCCRSCSSGWSSSAPRWGCGCARSARTRARPSRSASTCSSCATSP